MLNGDLKAVSNFMRSAKSIIRAGLNESRDIVTTALNASWKNYASNVDVRTLTPSSMKALTEMAKKYPGFRPMNESGKDAVLPARGKGLPQGQAAGQMPAYKSGNEKEIGTKENLIKRKQKNTYTSTPEVPGTAVGLTGKGSAPKMEALAKQDPALLENVIKLTKHIRKSLTESLSSGFKVKSFRLLVKEGEQIAQTPERYTLAEAVADAEELLLFHSPMKVRMAVQYTSKLGRPGQKILEMVSMKHREPIFFEGQALFRFERNAEQFANSLTGAGYASKVLPHNWGTSVMSESKKVATSVFKRLIV